MLINETKKVLYNKKKKKKEEKNFHIFLKIKFIQEKDLKQALEQFLESSHVFQKTLETLLDFNVRKEIQEKLNRKNKRKYKKKIRGRGFGDGFKLLHSFGKQRRKSMQ